MGCVIQSLHGVKVAYLSSLYILVIIKMQRLFDKECQKTDCKSVCDLLLLLLLLLFSFLTCHLIFFSYGKSADHRPCVVSNILSLFLDSSVGSF